MEPFHRRFGEACRSAFTEMKSSTGDMFTESANNAKQNVKRFYQTGDYYLQGEVPALKSLDQSISDMNTILESAKETFTKLFLKDRFSELTADPSTPPE